MWQHCVNVLHWLIQLWLGIIIIITIVVMLGNWTMMADTGTVYLVPTQSHPSCVLSPWWCPAHMWPAAWPGTWSTPALPHHHHNYPHFLQRPVTHWNTGYLGYVSCLLVAFPVMTGTYLCFFATAIIGHYFIPLNPTPSLHHTTTV